MSEGPTSLEPIPETPTPTVTKADTLPHFLRDNLFVTEGCWLWTAGKSAGYGRSRYERGKTRRAHRRVYELLIGPVPEGLELDHLCRNRACCNPWHLEPVTHRENILRGESPMALCAKKTTCVAGHPFSKHGHINVRGDRVCLVCDAIRARNYRRRTREGAICLRTV